MSFFIRKKNRLTSSFASSDLKKSNGVFKKNLKKPSRGQGAGRGKGKNVVKSGKRLSDREIQKLTSKKLKFDKNDVIESSEEEDEDDEEGDREDVAGTIDDELYFGEDAETAQEKKLRLAKLYLEEIEREERQRREDDDEEGEGDVNLEEQIGQRLKEDVLEQEGRLRREVASKLQPNLSGIKLLKCPKHLKRSVTCLCLSPDDQYLYTGSKDGLLLKWSILLGQKVAMVKRKPGLSKRKRRREKQLNRKGGEAEEDPNLVHSSTIMAIAISSDGKFLASGDMDNKIAIWNPETLKKLHIFTGHRGPIRGLAFRKKTHTLYSASDDKSVRIWSLDEMSYVETLFGHQDAVTCVDALTRERAISGGGRDNSIRVWKIVEESQLVYNGHYNGSIDVVKLVNEENFVSGGEDGSLCAWNVNRKKPLCTVEAAHGLNPTSDQSLVTPRWISALGTLPNTDLIASGSSDGFIQFWRCGERFKTLEPIFKVPCIGWINSLQFSNGENRFLVAGIGAEHRLGRWWDDIKDSKPSIAIIPLIPV